ncbi:outer membrane protein [Ostreiculturibacter nitratireducens]|uniref:outer membrane protein n=1 Tax=Ostreiculturibacter nitratireducens TaxID=3075226 RepID=UPI0031B6315F
MKYWVIAALAGIGFSSPVSAQSGPPADWSGYYIGVLAGSTDDRNEVTDNGAPYDIFDTSGSGAGAYLGYNVQTGAMVYGGELAYSPWKTDSNDHTVLQRDYLDLKGRLGYAMGQALFYGVVGYTHGISKENPANVSEDATGLNYGLGVEYQFAQRFTVGAEYLERRLDADYTDSGFPGYEGDIKSQSVMLRIGMKF